MSDIQSEKSLLFPDGMPELTHEQLVQVSGVESAFLASIAMANRRRPTQEEVARAHEGAVYEVTLSREERDIYNA